MQNLIHFIFVVISPHIFFSFTFVFFLAFFIIFFPSLITLSLFRHYLWIHFCIELSDFFFVIDFLFFFDTNFPSDVFHFHVYYILTLFFLLYLGEWVRSSLDAPNIWTVLRTFPLLPFSLFSICPPSNFLICHFAVFFFNFSFPIFLFFVLFLCRIFIFIIIYFCLISFLIISKTSQKHLYL